MTAGQYLFGFNGRINRAKYWLFVLILIGLNLIWGLIYAGVVGIAALGAIVSSTVAGAAVSIGFGAIVIYLLGLALGIIEFIASLAIGVKRLHDRGRGGAWVLLFYFAPGVLLVLGAILSASSGAGATVVSLIGAGIAIWGFVEMACLRGTVGPNRFGPDPLAPYIPASAPIAPAV